ncbi:methyltransferase [Pleurostoma richardsiae]|uniref:Methyltransferase n=1 Tax=Pleurostoma richardsiae TaxID=41990 RepID=A0AA38VJT8_9PEZI|nr:methyltransferase [Pleurostoma richardsiae]
MSGEETLAAATGGTDIGSVATAFQPPAAGSPPGGAAQDLHVAAHWAQLAEDEHGDDSDSAIGPDNASSTESMTPSILAYRTLHGRTYHSQRGNAQYWASNDEPQNDHHFLLLLLDGKLFLAPLKKDIQTVLDIGTGTGLWAIDFADEFPDANVIGTDISPIQPSWVPPNLTFEIEDCTEEWTFKPDSVDFVHMRYLYGSIKDWAALFREAYRVCKPGGWVESYEASPMMESDDGSVTEGSAMSKWGGFFIEGGRKLSRTFTVVDDDIQQTYMRDAGFVDIDVKNLKVPIGGWTQDAKLKEIGQYVQVALEADYEGYVMYMAGLLGWTEEEVTVYCAQLRREIRSRKYHPFYRQRVVWGRKPEGS